MKKILLLLLLATFSIQAQTLQNPTYGNVKLKNNATDNSATKVNVQSTDGTINTISKSDLVNVVEVNDVPSLPLVGEVGKIYVVKNVNKIYRWNGTFYQELAGSDISGLQAQIDLKANNSDVVKLTGNQSITGTKTFNNSTSGTSVVANNTSTGTGLSAVNSSTGTGIYSNNQSTGKGIHSDNNSTGISIYSLNYQSGNGIVSNQGVSGTGFNYVGQNNGTNTFTVNKLGATTATSFINSTAPANNILLAGGGDLAQNTAFNKNFGTTAGTVVEGNDSRLSDSRTPTAGSNSYIQNQNASAQSANMWISGTYMSTYNADGYNIELDKTGGFGSSLALRNSSLSSNSLLRMFKPNNTDFYDLYTSSTGIELNGTVTSTSFNGSATLTGTPTAPTATVGTNTTQVATTAFVTNGIATADSQNVKLTGNQTISGQKSFSLTGKIDMQTNNAFPAISVTALGSNGQLAAQFINNSSSPYSSALNLQTGTSGGVGNRSLDVLNTSPIGTGIVSNASSGGVSISSQSGNGDSYVSNITYGGTGRNYVGRNNGTETYSVDKTGSVTATQYKISALNTAPASATATGTTGEIRITAGFIYICIATNTWVRAALTTWI